MVTQIWWTATNVSAGGRMLTDDGKVIAEEFAKFGPPIIKQCLDWEAHSFEATYLEQDALQKGEKEEYERQEQENSDFDPEEIVMRDCCDDEEASPDSMKIDANILRQLFCIKAKAEGATTSRGKARAGPHTNQRRAS